MLKKVVFFVVLLALAKPALASFNPFAPFSYRMGLQLTNPLSFSSKYGGSLAYRFGQNAFMISYIKYVGAYQSILPKTVG